MEGRGLRDEGRGLREAWGEKSGASSVREVSELFCQHSCTCIQFVATH